MCGGGIGGGSGVGVGGSVLLGEENQENFQVRDSHIDGVFDAWLQVVKYHN